MARTRRNKDARSEFVPGFTEVALIGSGSLATVYEAREAGTNRRVALKLLNVRDVSAVESFERASMALGAVSSHPNIVTLYRYLRAADGRPVLVLELCHGTVADRVRDGRALSVAEGVALGIKIVGALDTAHRAGILHREVTPQNVLITEFGEPALSDFGLAALRSAAVPFDVTTPHLAPELLEGGEASPATDVYELASSVYELIARRPPIRADGDESPASVVLRILRDPVPPLADVPLQLSDLLLDAMAKDPSARPQSAAEFAAGLTAVEESAGFPRTRLLVRESGPAGPSRPPERIEPETARAIRYPIPPAGPVGSAAGTVPVWARRTPMPPPSTYSRQPADDVALDPMALRRRLTIRAGAASLTVDESGLSLRSGLRRRDLAWPQIRGFEPRFRGSTSGHLVAVTETGAVDLPATERAAEELRALRVVLDAYRQRAGALRSD